MIKNDDSEEKRDEEKSEDGLTKGESDEEEIEDEESKYITEVYAPVLVSVHQDSYIRFWTMEVSYFSQSQILVCVYIRTPTSVSGQWR